MSAAHKISPAHAMDLAWRDYHAEVPDDAVPMVDRSFNRAWMIQQDNIDALQQRIRVMKFAIHSAAEVLKHGTEQEMRETAGFLTAIERITEKS